MVTLRKAWPLLLSLALIALCGVAGVRSVVNSGPAAFAQMNAEERVLLGKPDTLRKGMSLAEVTAILGEPDESGPLGRRPK
jgi:hypothetical protein